MLYIIKYRLSLVLSLYGYCYNVYLKGAAPSIPWYKYLYADLYSLPRCTVSYMYIEDAIDYVAAHPWQDYVIRKERFIP